MRARAAAHGAAALPWLLLIVGTARAVPAQPGAAAIDPDILALRDPERRSQAIERLSARGPAVASQLAAWIEATAFEDPRACRAAAQVLMRFASDALHVAPRMLATKERIGRKRNPQPRDGLPGPLVRLDLDLELAIACTRLPAGATVETLAFHLKGDDSWMRAAAARTLARCGARGRGALRELAAHAKEYASGSSDASRSAQVDAAAAYCRMELLAAISAIDPGHPFAVDGYLARLTADPDDPLGRAAAARALGLLGNRARAAIPRLASAHRDPDRRVVREVITALGAIGVDSPSARMVLTRLLRHPDPDLARRAAVSLAQLDAARATAARQTGR